MEELKKENEKINPFDDMSILQRTVNSVIPEMFNIYFTDNQKYIRELIEKINTANSKANNKFWFNTGTENNTIDKFINYKEDHYILNNRLIKITGVWGSFSSIQDDDVLLFVFENLPKFKIEDEYFNGEYSSIAVINNDYICPEFATDSGYVRYNGKVIPVNELSIEYIYVNEDGDEKYFVIGTNYQCSIYRKNDFYLQALQKHDVLNEDLIRKYKKLIRNNKHPYIYECL